MPLFITLVLLYFFFVTKIGKEIFGILVSNIMFYAVVFLNPISLVIFGFFYIVFTGAFS